MEEYSPQRREEFAEFFYSSSQRPLKEAMRSRTYYLRNRAAIAPNPDYAEVVDSNRPPA